MQVKSVNMGKSANFSELEKETVLELVEKEKHIIEDKRNDGRMVAKKEKAWESLTRDFNSRPGVNKRTTPQLKRLWKNLKGKAKKSLAEERKSRKETGGGAEVTSVDSISQKVISITPQQIFSLRNTFDDDATFHGDIADDVSDDEVC